MARRLLKKKRRTASGVRRLGRALYRTAVAVSVLIVVFFCGFKALVRPPEQAAPPTTSIPSRAPASDDPDTPEDESAATPTPVPLVRKEGFYTFLLAATDVGGGNTDTIMVAAYDTAEQKVGVVSIPRDTLVDRSFPKINAVYGSGGIEALKETVSDLIGIPIDHYMTVNIRAFKALVDAVGGIDFYVPCDMDYDDSTPDQELYIHYKEGMQHLNGQQALEVVRFRHNNDGSGYTDVGRTQTQQKMLTAIAKKVLSWSSLSLFNNFVDIFTQNVKTDLSATDIAWFATQAVGVDFGTGVSTGTLPGDGDARYNGVSWCYQLDREGCLEIFNELLNPYTTEITLDMTNMFQVK